MSGTLSTPTVSSPNSTEDPKIATAVSTLNGLLTASNLLDGAQLGAATVPAAALASNAVTTAKITDANVTDAKLASPNNSSYRTLLNVSGFLGVDQTADKYLLGSGGYNDTSSAMMPSNTANTLVTTAHPPPPMIYFDDADYTVGGLTQKLRVRCQVSANATAPAITFTFGLYPLTVAGSNDTVTFTLGTVVPSSTQAIATPSASTITSAVNSDFTIPSDGAYALGVSTSGTIANNSAVLCSAQLQTRSV